MGLLHRFVELGGDAQALGLADRLYRFAREHGVAPDGGVFDQVDRAGRVIDGNQRLWPQTERLKAQATLLRARPDPALRAELEAALGRCFDRYVDADGGWREHLTPEGRPLTDVQNATSVYHVVAALGEVLRVADGWWTLAAGDVAGAEVADQGDPAGLDQVMDRGDHFLGTRRCIRDRRDQVQEGQRLGLRGRDFLELRQRMRDHRHRLLPLFQPLNCTSVSIE